MTLKFDNTYHCRIKYYVGNIYLLNSKITDRKIMLATLCEYLGNFVQEGMLFRKH